MLRPPGVLAGRPLPADTTSQKRGLSPFLCALLHIGGAEIGLTEEVDRLGLRLDTLVVEGTDALVWRYERPALRVE